MPIATVGSSFRQDQLLLKPSRESKMPLLETVLSACKDIAPLRKGGQREVYRAHHPEYGRVVIKHSIYRSDVSLHRLSREAEYLESLDSPCIPKLYALLVDPGSKECVTIEAFIASRELEECREDFSSQEEIVRLIRALVRCMTPVWRDRVVHRDLKPTNIVINDDGKPCVVDFGIARFLDESSLTQSAAWMGPATPVYAAPEQLLNQKHLIDLRTDFFALGIIGLELHLGFHPFSPEVVGGESIPENIIESRYAAPNIKPGTTQPFGMLIRRLLQRQPYMRFRTPEALEDFLNDHWEAGE